MVQQEHTVVIRILEGSKLCRSQYLYFHKLIFSLCSRFHVSTLIPFNPRDPQQVERKRHLGNDVVVILFKEGNAPFNPSSITSHFNHVFIVVQVHSKDDYEIAMCTIRDVPPFGPPIPPKGVISVDEVREFVCVKGKP